MSVHQESLEISKPAERIEEAPELEYRAVSHDSLSMFLAAIGGAILGMLLTLLILALINGGTLSFSGGERLTVFEATLDRVNANVGAVSANVDLVSQQAQAVSDQLASAELALRNELANQDANIATLGEAVSQLDRTRQQFDLFMGALGQVMTDMQNIDAATAPVEASPAEAAPVEAAPAAEAVALAAPVAMISADVPVDALSVVLFVDANANGALDEGEATVEGVSVALFDGEGNVVASELSTEDGVLFTDLSSGVYQISVETAPGYTLLSGSEAEVTVAEGDEAEIGRAHV